MSRLTLPISILGFLLLAASLGRAEVELTPGETILVDELFSESGEDVASFNALSLFYVDIPKTLCQRCSTPCAKMACCSGKFPQCCRISGQCRCCKLY